MIDTATEWTFLRSGDFAGTVTPARGVPNLSTTPDELVAWHLANRTLLVDTDAGVICKSDGATRAETPTANGIGRVYLGKHWGKIRWSPAHRVVWIAKHGPIAGNYRVAHRNGRPWDNRIDNLEVITHSELMRHKRGALHLGDDINGIDDRPTIRPHTALNPVPRKNLRYID